MGQAIASRAIALVAVLAVSMPGIAADPPSRYGIDAPELAHLGPYAVGVKTLHLREPAQADVLAYDPVHDSAPLRDRELSVELWYPARPKAGAAPVTYSASFPSEPPAPPASFSVPGIAVRDAAAAGQGFPLVIFSHGYRNDPVATTWLTENLASKGYVVAGIRHGDPFDPHLIVQPLLRRPLDIGFVARTLQRRLGAERLIDPGRTALIGYSMGGYGVLTSAGASLDPGGPPAQRIPGKLLMPYVRGGALEGEVRVPGLRAAVAISPFGGGSVAAWGAEGFRSLSVPLLLIAGDRDRTVDYLSGARAFFDAAVNAHRYLLTFKNAGHSLGHNPAPEAMRKRLWDQDWFEDPVWRKERINAINAHFITAFLDRYLKGDATREAYLNVPVAESSEGVWPEGVGPAAYGAYSPGALGITVWKGFQRKEAAGLELLQAVPATAAVPP